MNLAEATISIIIATHNRVDSIKRLLDNLGSQFCPVPIMEVIVVADSYTGSMASLIQNYKAPFKLLFCETFESGPAVFRNKGASLATGSLLIFIDEDVDLSDGFIKAHMLAHQNKENAVVIGYLKLVVPTKPGYFKLEQQAYWEEKFQRMRTLGYRFHFTDIPDSNFSIPASLFKKLNGFVNGLTYREVDEFGIRLIRSGVDLIFSKDAQGFLRNVIINLNHSLKRKREEGKADVRLWRMYPDQINTHNVYSRLKTKYAFWLYKNTFLLFTLLRITDVFASGLRYLMFVLEKLQFRGKWKTLYHKLHWYWYTRGVLEELHKKQDLSAYFKYASKFKTPDEALEIDIKAGLTAVVQLLDQLRPDSILLRYGTQMIGTIPSKPGAERLKGNHLRYIIAMELPEAFIMSFAMDEMMNNGQGCIV